MTHIERARLKPGRLIEWKGRHFSYKGYSYQTHHLKEMNVSALAEYPNGMAFAVPIYEHLSNREILDAMVEGLN